MANESLLAQLRDEISSIESRAPSSPPKKERRGAFSADDGEWQQQAPARTREHERRGAFEKIVALVNISDRSERSIRDRLTRDGFEQDDIEDAIARSKEYGFIDDRRFAELLVRSRIAQGKGSVGIERELKTHDIDVNDVPGWPFDYPLDHDQEVERALDLLRRKPPRSKNPREGAYRKLAGKGYPSSVASTAARMWCEQQS